VSESFQGHCVVGRKPALGAAHNAAPFYLWQHAAASAPARCCARLCAEPCQVINGPAWPLRVGGPPTWIDAQCPRQGPDLIHSEMPRSKKPPAHKAGGFVFAPPLTRRSAQHQRGCVVTCMPHAQAPTPQARTQRRVCLPLWRVSLPASYVRWPVQRGPLGPQVLARQSAQQPVRRLPRIR
jgi:hypothetical protein